MNWPLITLGKPDKPALVFLHGFLGTGADWLPVARPLSARYFCLLPDLPGHGKNPLDAAPGYQAWSQALAATLDAYKLNTITLAGYSMGARLALFFALHFADRVGRLLLESANPGISDVQERSRRAAWDDANARTIRDLGLASFLGGWYTLPLFASLDRIPNARETLRRKRARQDGESMARVIRALSPGRQPDLWPLLPSLRVPTLYLAGALDSKYTTIAQRFQQKYPASEVTIVAQAGHNIHVEAPQAFRQHVEGWL